MNLSEIEVPSNQKFGFFFSGIFLAASTYFYIGESTANSYLLAVLGILFLITTLLKADILLPLNKLWMRLGFLLGIIISPIVVGVIFFGLYTPISLTMRFFGRDYLRLRLTQKSSHWIIRETNQIQSNDFKNQF